MIDFKHLTYSDMMKIAAAILTPEAEQAAVQPPMDPAMAGGAAPMPPQGAPMDPAMAGGAPAGDLQAPTGPADATGPRGGEIPPEILQDQMFMQFLMEALGVVYDPNSGMFMDPNGQPIPVEMILQAYQEFQRTMQQQQAVQPPQGAPMDPAMAGGAPMDPAMQGGMPPEGGATPPADMGAPIEAPAAQEGAPTEQPQDPINEIASAVMSGVEAVLQEYTASTEKRISAVLDKLEALTKAIDALQSTTDRREQQDKDADAQLRDEIAADLMPTTKAASRSATAAPINLFDAITGNKR